MAAGDAEADGPSATALRELFEGVFGARLGRDGFGQGGLVEPPAAPGNLGILDRVGHAEIVERRQKAPVDPGPEIAFVDEVFLAEAQKVTAVAAIRRGGQAQQKAWLEMIDDPPIGGGGRVVEFVDDDVVEGAWVETG